jgi:hypothetical protein
VAKRRHPPVLDRREETAESATSRLVEEDPLNGLGGAELERLLERGLLDLWDR